MCELKEKSRINCATGLTDDNFLAGGLYTCYFSSVTLSLQTNKNS